MLKEVLRKRDIKSECEDVAVGFVSVWCFVVVGFGLVFLFPWGSYFSFYYFFIFNMCCKTASLRRGNIYQITYSLNMFFRCREVFKLIALYGSYRC